MILEILFVLILSTFSFFIWENYFENPKLPPGPLKIPILGSLVQMAMADSRHYIAVDKLSRKYGKILSVKMGGQLAVFITDYSIFKTIFSMDEANDRKVIGILLDRQFHNPNIGFIGSRGTTWEETRRFCGEGLKPYGFGNRRVLENRLEYEMESFYTKLDQLRTISSYQNEVHFTPDLFDPIVINQLLTMLIGERMGHDSEIIQQLIHANELFINNGVVGAGILTAFPFLRYVIPKWLGVDKQLEGIRLLNEISRNLIQLRKEDGSYKISPFCFVDEFLSKIENLPKWPPGTLSIFDMQSLQMIMIDILQTGFETTSSGMNFSTLLIGSHPEVQEQLVAEINLVCGTERNPVLSDRVKMPYAQAIVTEIYRWGRIVVFGALRAAASDIKYRKYIIPKGTLLLPNFHSMFFDKDFWGDPYSFRPGRFLDEKNNLIQSKIEVVAAFGAGKRNCFGESLSRDILFYFFTNLFRKYKLSVPKGNPMPSFEPTIGVTFGPIPYKLCVELRN